MKFCENHHLGLLYQMLSCQDVHGNSGFSHLESQGFAYVKEPGDADFFVSVNGKISPKFPLSRTILLLSEPYSRYKARYQKNFRNPFGGFMGIRKDDGASEDEFYFVPQEFTKIQDLKDYPEFWVAMIHQRYKKEYRNLLGDNEREKAVAFFDEVFKDEFHTYGRVWEQTRSWDNVGWKGVIKGLFMGNEKLLTLRNYKFTLCMENSRECGYVTEKIFSAFFAGSVPLYFGATDIAEYIPNDCYIEFDGTDYPSLIGQIKSMGDQEFHAMRTRARDFIFSPKCEQFTSIDLAKKLKRHFLRVESMPKNLYDLENLWRKANLWQIKLRLKTGLM